MRTLSGAALYFSIEKQLRETLAEWEIPLDRYTCTVARDFHREGPYYDGGPISEMPLLTLTATFTNIRTSAEIIITGIYVYDNGEISQFGTQHGGLTL
jgi:hypothetical protein